MFNFAAIIKYVLEGLAVALAAFFIPQRKADVKEIVLIALTAAAVFSILDQFSPLTGASARQGAGFGIGLNQVGWGGVQNSYYGGQDPRLSCSCEVDADYLRSQVCTSTNSSTDNTTSNQDRDSVKPAANTTANTDAVNTDSTVVDSNPASVNIVNKNGQRTTYTVKDNSARTVEPFDGFGQTW